MLFVYISVYISADFDFLIDYVYILFLEFEMALSEAWLKANNGKERKAVEVVADRDSMSVRISPKGKIVFQLRYRFNNKQERIDLGTYPHMSLKDARLEATRLRGLLDQNKNPKLELLVEKEKNINPITLNEVH